MTFLSECRVGPLKEKGDGNNKKEAKQRAATRMLHRLIIEGIEQVGYAHAHCTDDLVLASREPPHACFIIEGMRSIGAVLRIRTTWIRILNIYKKKYFL